MVHESCLKEKGEGGRGEGVVTYSSCNAIPNVSKKVDTFE